MEMNIIKEVDRVIEKMKINENARAHICYLNHVRKKYKKLNYDDNTINACILDIKDRFLTEKKFEKGRIIK